MVAKCSCAGGELDGSVGSDSSPLLNYISPVGWKGLKHKEI